VEVGQGGLAPEVGGGRSVGETPMIGCRAAIVPLTLRFGASRCTLKPIARTVFQLVTAPHVGWRRLPILEQ
jgi:hypothetical protein